MAIKAPRGTFDILPERAVIWNHVESTARKIFELWGYGEIRSPVFENVELFASSIGETTDILEKEMYVFQKGREKFALRPEETASVVRSYIEHNLNSEPCSSGRQLAPLWGLLPRGLPQLLRPDGLEPPQWWRLLLCQDS